MDEHKLRTLWEQQLKDGGPIRQWEEYQDLVPKAYRELMERATNLPYDDMPIQYGTLGARIGLYPYSEWFQLKIGHVVGACSVYENQHDRPLISALVISSETNRPGKGFWGLPGIPPHMRKVTKIEDITPEKLDVERDAFWVEEMRRIDRTWKQL